MIAAAVLPEGGDLQVHSGTRVMTIRWDDTDDYYGERALRGRFLPQGWRKVPDSRSHRSRCPLGTAPRVVRGDGRVLHALQESLGWS